MIYVLQKQAGYKKRRQTEKSNMIVWIESPRMQRAVKQRSHNIVNFFPHLVLGQTVLLSHRSRRLPRNCLGIFTDVTKTSTWSWHCNSSHKSKFKSVTYARCGFWHVEIRFHVLQAKDGVIFQQNIYVFLCCVSCLFQNEPSVWNSGQGLFSVLSHCKSYACDCWNNIIFSHFSFILFCTIQLKLEMVYSNYICSVLEWEIAGKTKIEV